MKKLILLLFGGLLFSQVTFAQTNYPEPVGHVNDFANILNSQDKQSLETKLRDYRDKTSIEIAVVTVVSLEGSTVEDYTLNLAQKWGVGDKEKDTGIVILVAPKEHKMRIEVGYGMEPDLTDAQAGRIIQGIILPAFKTNRMNEGIVAGVNAILADLGDKPYQARLEERKLAEEKRLAEEKKRAEETAIFLKMARIVIGIGIIIFAVAFSIYKMTKCRRALMDQHSKNAGSLGRCHVLLKEAREEYPKAEDRLKDLEKNSAKNVWISFEQLLDKAPNQIESGEKRLDQLTILRLENGWRKSEETAVKIGELIVAATALANLLDDVNAKINEVRVAKEKSPKLLKELASSIESAKNDLDHKDVTAKTKKYLDDAKSQHDKVGSLMDNSLVDWLMVYGLIAEAISLISKARNAAKSDITAVKEARKPKSKRSSHHSYSSSSKSSSSSGSSWSSSSSNSFGGFGGGSFGGGGASGSW